MKSYFARLAARAVAGTPRVVPAAKPSIAKDPFEDSVEAAAPEYPTRVGPGPYLTEQIDRERSVVSDTQLQPKEDRTLQSKPRSLPERIVSEPVPRSLVPRFDDESQKDTRDAGGPSEELSALPSSSQPGQDTKTEETVLHPTVDARAVSERDRKELRREQAALLRKADAFMERLLGSRTTRENDNKVEPSLEQVIEPSEKAKTESAVSLKPVVPAPVVVEREREKPSLVIGKLTVEVTPPSAPAPVAPTRVVVVRERGRSRPGFQTGHRFGFGQF